MKGLYLLLDGITVLFPILLSFDRRVRYVSQWKNVFISSSLIAIPFLIWDVFFTVNGVWGFNPDYLVGIHFFSLPIEEIAFFWVVPFACLFIYACCRHYFREIHFQRLNGFVQIALTIYVATLAIAQPTGWYSWSIVLSSLTVLAFWLKNPHPFLGIAFLISLLPFLCINGILTGSFLDAPIVFYSNEHIAGWRIFTIPFEDVAYCFSLVGGSVLILERLRKSASK